MNSEIGFIKKLLEAFEENKISFEHLPSGIDTVSVILPRVEYEEKKDAIMASLRRLLDPDKIEVDTDLALVTVVGRGMRSVSGIAATFFTCLGMAHVNIKMIDMGSNEINCTIGVKNEDFEKAIRALYHALVEAIKRKTKSFAEKSVNDFFLKKYGKWVRGFTFLCIYLSKVISLRLIA